MQHIVFDVEDELFTLRERFDYVLIGGDGADAPLSEDTAGELAITLLELGVSAILQLNDFGLAGQRRVIARFLAGLMKAPRPLWHPVLITLDEAHRYAPQSAPVESSEAIVNLATAGRKRGFGALFATQRLSSVSAATRRSSALALPLRAPKRKASCSSPMNSAPPSHRSRGAFRRLFLEKLLAAFDAGQWSTRPMMRSGHCPSTSLESCEQPRQNAHGQKEAGPAGDPAQTVRREAAPWDVRMLQKPKNPARRFSGGKIEGFERSAWKQLVGRPDQEADAVTPLDGTRLGSGVWPGSMEFSVEISRVGRASGVGASGPLLGSAKSPSRLRRARLPRRADASWSRHRLQA